MGSTDAEYLALAKFIQADKRQRLFVNALVVVCFGLFVFTAVQLLNLNNTIVREVKGVLTQQQKLSDDAQADARIRTEEFRGYITCLFITPIEKRTPVNQRLCFNRSDLPGGRDASEFTPIVITDSDLIAEVVADEAVGPSSSSVVVTPASNSSSSNTAPTAATAQPNNSQQPTQQSSQVQPQATTPPVATTPEPQTPQPSLIDRVMGVLGGLLSILTISVF